MSRKIISLIAVLCLFLTGCGGGSSSTAGGGSDLRSIWGSNWLLEVRSVTEVSTSGGPPVTEPVELEYVDITVSRVPDVFLSDPDETGSCFWRKADRMPLIGRGAVLSKSDVMCDITINGLGHECELTSMVELDFTSASVKGRIDVRYDCPRSSWLTISGRITGRRI